MTSVTLREIAAEHGYSLRHVRGLAGQDGWPKPVGQRATPHTRGVRAYLYDQAAVNRWMKQRRAPTPGQWALQQIGTELGIKYGSVKAARHDGRLPSPDGWDGHRPWWRPETVRTWWATCHPPEGAWTLERVRAATGYREPTGVRGFPPPDGTVGRTAWWHSTTVVSWLGRRRLSAQ